MEAELAWHSHYGQDRVVAALFAGSPAPFFVDVGAADPFLHSNTAALEQRGWHGLCLEADASLLHKLTKLRTCNVLGAAVSNVQGHEVAMVMTPSVGRAANATRTVARVVKNHSIADLRREEAVARASGGALEAHGVRSSSLPALLELHRAPSTIEYVSFSLSDSAVEEDALVPLLLDSRRNILSLTLTSGAGDKLRSRLSRTGFFWVDSVRFGAAGQLWVHASQRSAARERVRQPQMPVPMGVGG